MLCTRRWNVSGADNGFQILKTTGVSVTSALGMDDATESDQADAWCREQSDSSGGSR
jgi:hypothetical protein